MCLKCEVIESATRPSFSADWLGHMMDEKTTEYWVEWFARTNLQIGRREKRISAIRGNQNINECEFYVSLYRNQDQKSIDAMTTPA